MHCDLRLYRYCTSCSHFQHCHSLSNHLYQLDIKITQFFPSNFQTLWLERNNAFLLGNKNFQGHTKFPNNTNGAGLHKFQWSIDWTHSSISPSNSCNPNTALSANTKSLPSFLSLQSIDICNRVADSYWTSRWIAFTTIHCAVSMQKVTMHSIYTISSFIEC